MGRKVYFLIEHSYRGVFTGWATNAIGVRRPGFSRLEVGQRFTLKVEAEIQLERIAKLVAGCRVTGPHYATK